MKKILVTGAGGQIGTELIESLCSRHGSGNVLATDSRPVQDFPCRFTKMDVTDSSAVERKFSEERFDAVYHLAAILSAKGEVNPDLAFNVNINGTKNVLDASLRNGVERVIIPSTIGVFGPTTPKDNVAIETVTRPTTIYGITKLFCEQLGDYYSRKYGMDVRGLRLPGIISYRSPPGGGTTDYAVEMIVSAVRRERYVCFLRKDTRLPMMYIPDAISSMIKLAESPASSLIHRTDFNVSAFEFTPEELETELKSYFPDIEVAYRPDERQKIADSWPHSVDSQAAASEWGFEAKFNFRQMVDDMVKNLVVGLRQRNAPF
ncbi:MAG: NAD-dependent epimerase/dehydratase family protein [Thermoplasmata archaeon]|nr:NAD-dependent epimerase/dehydratase family protein [Candidatus Sysuiplasma jiujiangense]